MKLVRYLAVVTFLMVFTCCTTNNKKPAVAATPAIKNNLELLKDSCGKLQKNGDYSNLVITAKKGLASAISINDFTSAAFFSLSAGLAHNRLKQKDSTLFYYNLSERFGYKIKSIAHIIDCQDRLSSLYYELGLADSLSASKAKMEIEADTIKDPKLKVQLAESLGIFYATHNEPQKALADFFANVKYHKEQNDTAATGADLNYIGRVYMQIGDKEKALRYSVEALPYLQDRHKIACLNLVGDNFTTLHKPDSAVIYHKQAIALSRAINDSLYLYNSYVQLCDALIALKQFDEVPARLQEALMYFNRSNAVNSVIDVYTTLATVESSHENFAGAIDFDKKALAYASSSQHDEWKTFLYGELTRLFSTTGQYKEAYGYQRLYSTAWDSANQASSKKNVQEIETRYQTAQKEQQIKLLSQQALIKDIDLKDQRRTWWFLFAAFCFLLIVVALVLRGYRLKRKSNELLEKNNNNLNVLNQKLNQANQSKTKLFSIISHDLRSPVSSLFTYLQFEKKMMLTETEEQLDRTRMCIKQTASDVLESMEDILIWSKSQMEHFEPDHYPVNLPEVFTEIVSMHSVMAHQKNITVHASCSDGLTINTDPNFLKIIVRNLLSNGIKFTPAGGNIYLSAQKNSNSVTITVRDDGKGIPEGQLRSIFEWNSVRSDSSGLGLRLTKEFVEKLNASISVTSMPGAGTTFTVSFVNPRAELNQGLTVFSNNGRPQ